jgi:hypothetical protein
MSTCGSCPYFEECTKRDWRTGVGSHEEQHDPECPARTNEREMLKALEAIRDYGNAAHERGNDEGYPGEIVYDEFTYKRIVDAYREAANKAIQKAKSKG